MQEPVIKEQIVDKKEIIPFVTGILKSIGVPDHEIKTQFFTKESIERWNATFTHQSIDAIHNYEYFEKIGDAILKILFINYLTLKYPGLETDIEAPRKISNVENMFMSKNKQSEFSDKLKLSKYISYNLHNTDDMLTSSDITIISIKEDLFEAFFGCLYKIGESIKPGVGYIYCFNLLIVILKTETIPEDTIRDYKSTIKEMFDKLGSKYEYRRPTDRGKEFAKFGKEEKFNGEVPKYMILVKASNENHRKIVIGKSYIYGQNKKVAINDAYKQAFEYFKANGITPKLAQTIKRKRDISINTKLKSLSTQIDTKITEIIKERKDLTYIDHFVTLLKDNKIYLIIDIKNNDVIKRLPIISIKGIFNVKIQIYIREKLLKILGNDKARSMLKIKLEK